MKPISQFLSFFAFSILACSFGTNKVEAQQDVQLTQFMFDKLSINPGVTGLSNSICASAFYRSQWTNFDGAPVTKLINFQMPVKALRGGLGFTYYNDQLGFESNNIARFHYAYHLSPGGFGNLGIGASVGLMSKRIDANWITPSGDDWVLDPSIASPNSSALAPDFSLGMYYTTGKLYMGLSATHLTESTLSNLQIQSARHYWIMAGYKMALRGMGQWELNPNVMAKSDASSTQLDINILVHYRRMIFAGISYRVQDAVAPMVGGKYPIKNGMLSFSYSYDATTSKIRSYSNGSHEIRIAYCFKPDPKSVEIYDTPR